MDPVTGLVQMKARWYDSDAGIFISEDPRSYSPTDPFGLHEYLYANADPVNNYDPSGMAAEPYTGETIPLNEGYNEDGTVKDFRCLHAGSNCERPQKEPGGGAGGNDKDGAEKSNEAMEAVESGGNTDPNPPDPQEEAKKAEQAAKPTGNAAPPATAGKDGSFGSSLEPEAPPGKRSYAKKTPSEGGSGLIDRFGNYVASGEAGRDAFVSGVEEAFEASFDPVVESVVKDSLKKKLQTEAGKELLKKLLEEATEETVKKAAGALSNAVSVPIEISSEIIVRKARGEDLSTEQGKAAILQRAAIATAGAAAVVGAGLACTATAPVCFVVGAGAGLGTKFLGQQAADRFSGQITVPQRKKEPR